MGIVARFKIYSQFDQEIIDIIPGITIYTFDAYCNCLIQLSWLCWSIYIEYNTKVWDFTDTWDYEFRIDPLLDNENDDEYH